MGSDACRCSLTSGQFVLPPFTLLTSTSQHLNLTVKEETIDPPVARILLVLGRRVGEGGHVFVHEGAKAQPEVAGELPHLLGQLVAQTVDGVQVVFHGKREVHQVVQINRVVLHLPHLQVEPRPVS